MSTAIRATSRVSSAAAGLGLRVASCWVLSAPAAAAQPEATPPPPTANGSTVQPTAASEDERDPATERPFFLATALDGEVGSDFGGGPQLALFATPLPGMALGGSAFVAPLVWIPACGCSALRSVVWRWMAELRYGTAYADYRRSLVWFGFGAGATFISGTGLDPSPVFSLSFGVDLRMRGAFWFEVSPVLTWAQMIGSSTIYASDFVTLGLELGLRFDIAH
jgi:hypothetical protein